VIDILPALQIEYDCWRNSESIGRSCLSGHNGSTYGAVSGGAFRLLSIENKKIIKNIQYKVRC
jgi:hypothetical protein